MGSAPRWHELTPEQQADARSRFPRVTISPGKIHASVTMPGAVIEVEAILDAGMAREDAR